MAWPNPFRTHDKNTRTCWGYTFQLTDDHLTEEASRPLKLSYDKLGEECLNILNEIAPSTKLENGARKSPAVDSEKPQKSKSRRDLYKLLEAHATDHPKLEELWNQLNTVPVWVDWDQVRWRSILPCLN
jgi:hypothetical protein